MSKITRISYNSSGWQRPTGDARKHEQGGTYNHTHGFGHEDWLFRSEWMIDGWRYAFLQGVNKSHAKLVKAGQSVDITLFTIQPDKKRRYVGSIRTVECLSDQQADDALEEFRQRGWLTIMQQEIIAVGGDAAALGATRWAKHILNVRFRLEDLTPFPANKYATASDPVQNLKRYMLYDVADIVKAARKKVPITKTGSTRLPAGKSFRRPAVAPVVCTPEHAHMQAKLMKELQDEYPKAKVVRERDFVDVSVQTRSELLLFEIKSDLEPRSVIRQALGQILEYAFHPSRKQSSPVRLFIVGRNALSDADMAYLKRLQTDFSLPIEYRTVSI